ncbi:MAG: phosphatidylinositol kinase [Bacteroidetes bacterium]|nr:MAG: phosphatidylinositol kinase [Bacteroidota bacterium]
MRQLEVYNHGILAGILTEVSRESYVFRYDDAYFHDKTKFAISLTLPKTQQEYQSKHIFPFFSNMIAEGANRALQRAVYQIDDDDVVSFLIHTAQYDTIGSVTVKLI